MRKLKTVRAKMIAELASKSDNYGTIVKGNLQMRRQDTRIIFLYRSTPIALYDLKTGTYLPIDADRFEHTPATRSQRKALKQAIKEFRAFRGED